MFRGIIVVLAVLGIMALFSSSPALSQVRPKEWVDVDLNTLDCRDFLRTSGRERDLVVAFYHGVVTGMKKETIVNVPLLSEVTDKAVEQCIDNPKEFLLKVFQSKRQ